MFKNIASSPRGGPALEAEEHINNPSNIYKPSQLWRTFTVVDSYHPRVRQAGIIIPTLQRGKLMLREVKWLAQGHKAYMRGLRISTQVRLSESFSHNIVADPKAWEVTWDTEDTLGAHPGRESFCPSFRSFDQPPEQHCPWPTGGLWGCGPSSWKRRHHFLFSFSFHLRVFPSNLGVLTGLHHALLPWAAKRDFQAQCMRVYLHVHMWTFSCSATWCPDVCTCLGEGVVWAPVHICAEYSTCAEYRRYKDACAESALLPRPLDII